MAKTLFNISDKIVAGNAPGELLAYRDRIIADGGTLETFAETEAEIRRLQSLGLYDSLSLGYIAGGYKASKWYNIKGATGDLDVVRATDGTRQNRAGLIDTLGNNLTRADFEDGVLKGNWVESAATNLVTATFNDTPPVPISLDPDNVFGSRFSNSTTAVSVSNLNPSSTYTAYCWVYIPSEFDFVGWQIRTTNAGATIAQQEADISIRDQWQYIELTFTNADTCNFRTNGAGTNREIYVKFVQVTEGANRFSYIPVNGATATRNADNISKTGIASEIGQTEGTLMVKMIALREKTATSRIIQINDGTSDNRILVWIGADGLMRVGSSISGAFTQWFVLSSIITGDVNVALSYKSGDTQMRVNGVDMGVYDTPFTLNTMSQINIGHQLGANQLNDTVYSAYVWKTAKTDAELIALTTL